MGVGRRVSNHLWTLADMLFRHPQWNVGIVDQPIHAFLEPDARPSIRWFPPRPKGTYLADPFGVVQHGVLRILCEEYDYPSRKGDIVGWDLSEGGRPTRSDVAMSLPFHASYPYLAEHRGEIYCVPENHETREIRLYKAIRFPHEWMQADTLVKGVAAVDPTLFEHEGRWWLAATDHDRGQHEWLSLWHAPDLRGPWEPHAANPVKVDSGSARPAGTPFRHRSTLYRPAQDCSQTYGGRIVIQKIDRLTPTEFQETWVATVEPDRHGPYPEGIHTISQAGSKTLVDGLRYTLEPTGFQDGVREEVSSIWRFARLPSRTG